MRIFSLFTTDTRYSVPTLTLIVAAEEAAAISRAAEILAASAFHAAVEVCEGDQVVYREFKSREATPRRTDRQERPGQDDVSAPVEAISNTAPPNTPGIWKRRRSVTMPTRALSNGISAARLVAARLTAAMRGKSSLSNFGDRQSPSGRS
jgi:hypothetical protein